MAAPRRSPLLPSRAILSSSAASSASSRQTPSVPSSIPVSAISYSQSPATILPQLSASPLSFKPFRRKPRPSAPHASSPNLLAGDGASARVSVVPPSPPPHSPCSPSDPLDHVIALACSASDKIGSAIALCYTPMGKAAAEDSVVQSVLRQCAKAAPDVMQQLSCLGQHAPLVGIIFSMLNKAGQILKETNGMVVAYTDFYNGLITTSRLMLQADADYQLIASLAQQPLEDFWVALGDLITLMVRLRDSAYLHKLWSRNKYRTQLDGVERRVKQARADLELILGWETHATAKAARQEVRHIHKAVNDLKQEVKASHVSTMTILKRPLPPVQVAVIDEVLYSDAVQRAFLLLQGVAATEHHDTASSPPTLQDVFVPQDVHLTPASYSDSDLSTDYTTLCHPSAYSSSVTKAARRSVMALLRDSAVRCLVVLGAPGSGKSSALRSHALAWATAAASERAVQPFPVVVELKQYAHDRQRFGSLLDCVAEGGTACMPLDKAALVQLMESDRGVLLMLDGMDEVFDSDLRAAVYRDIKQFVQQFPFHRTRVILTSRMIGYRMSELLPYDFKHYTLQPLTTEQIFEFVRRWYDTTYSREEKSVREERSQRLSTAVINDPSMLPLAENPLLLTMIAIVCTGPQLPKQRVALYDVCCELLLARWKTNEAVKAVHVTVGHSITLFTRERKEALLMDIATRMQQSEPTLSVVLRQDLLEGVILEHVLKRGLQTVEPELVVHALIKQLQERHNIICWLGGTSYAFVHRTFLEYFYAKQVAQCWVDQSINAQWLVLLFSQRGSEETWHEVLVLLSGMLPSIVLYPCLDALRLINLRLALLCLEQFTERDEKSDVESRLQATCDGRMKGDDGHFLCTHLTSLWPDSEIVRRFLEQAVVCHDERTVVTGIWALVRRWPDDRSRLLLEQAAVSEHGCLFGTVDALCTVWPKVDTYRVTMEAVARSTRREDDQQPVGAADYAVEVLAARWPDDRTRALLETIIERYRSATRNLTYAYETAASAAMSALLRRWKDDNTRSLVKRLLVERKISTKGASKILAESHNADRDHFGDDMCFGCNHPVENRICLIEWYYMDRKGIRHGPSSECEIKEGWLTGTVNGECLAWNQGLEEWSTINSLTTFLQCLNGPNEWYFEDRRGIQHGPCSELEIKEYWLHGTIDGNSFAWHPDLLEGGWCAICDHPILLRYLNDAKERSLLNDQHPDKHSVHLTGQASCDRSHEWL